MDGRRQPFVEGGAELQAFRTRTGAGGAYGLSVPSGRGSFPSKGLYLERNGGARVGIRKRLREAAQTSPRAPCGSAGRCCRYFAAGRCCRYFAAGRCCRGFRYRKSSMSSQNRFVRR